MQLMTHIGRAYQAMRNYDLGKAIRVFQSLPAHHWETPWVLGQVAFTYFAAERFEKVFCCLYNARLTPFLSREDFSITTLTPAHPFLNRSRI